MPETPASAPVVAMALLVSALTLFVLAVLVFTGIVPLAEELRMPASIVIGVAAFADLLLGIWFFRKSQSS